MDEQSTIEVTLSFRPETLAFFQNPEPNGMLVERNRPAAADAVGEIQFPARVVDYGLGQLSAHCSPGAGPEKSPVFPRGFGQSGQRGGKFVRTGSDDTDVLQPGVFGDVRPEQADFGAGANDRRKEPARQVKSVEQPIGPGLGERIVKLREAGQRRLDTGAPSPSK